MDLTQRHIPLLKLAQWLHHIHAIKSIIWFSLCCVFLFTFPAHGRNTLKIVGSGTVFPYANAVSKAYALRYKKEQPKIVPGGSGRGFRAFCAGLGDKFPDITNASRPMNFKEWNLCHKNGVTDITEVHFGSDGIALVTSHHDKTLKNLTRIHLYKAIAQFVPINGIMTRNPYRNWQEIDPALPNKPIQIYGPNKGEGTYYILVKVLIRQVCQQKSDYFKALKYSTTTPENYNKQIKKYCSLLRNDGNFISLSAGPEQILKILGTNKGSLFFTGYSVLFSNRDKLRAISINDTEPRVYTISDKSYILNRPLFFYIKNQHRKEVPLLSKYVKEFMSDRAMDTFGYLIKQGLGVLSFEDLRAAQYAVAIGSKMRRFENRLIKKRK